MWDNVLIAFKDALKRFNWTETELCRRTWQALQAKICEQVAEPLMLGKLRGYFEERFRYDETGVPRVWKPSDDIKGVFKVAKDDTLAMYAKVTPKDPKNAYKMPDDADDGDEFDFATSLAIFQTRKSSICKPNLAGM